MTDDEFITEIRRRLVDDPGAHYDWYDVLSEFALCIDDLEPDTPQRMWILARGNWLSPRCSTNPDGTVKDFLPAPPVFLGGDEFGNRPLCIRLPGHGLLCINWRIPLLSEPYDPDGAPS